MEVSQKELQEKSLHPFPQYYSKMYFNHFDNQDAMFNRQNLLQSNRELWLWRARSFLSTLGSERAEVARFCFTSAKLLEVQLKTCDACKWDIQPCIP